MKRPHTPRMKLLWSPTDTEVTIADFERHAAEALEASKAIHPATLSKQLQQHVADSTPPWMVKQADMLRQAVEQPEEYAQPCPVYDIRTGRRVDL